MDNATGKTHCGDSTDDYTCEWPVTQEVSWHQGTSFVPAPEPGEPYGQRYVTWRTAATTASRCTGHATELEIDLLADGNNALGITRRLLTEEPRP